MRNCAIAGSLAAILLLHGQAAAQSPSESVCLAKTDPTGGRMRFVVLEADAGRFEQAGFQRIPCPLLDAALVRGQADRCARLLAQSSEDQAALGALYGMAVADMCAATAAWAQSQTGE